MKLPSIDHIVGEAGRTVRRFPVALLVALIGTIASLILIDTSDGTQPLALYNVLFACVLGFPLLLAVAVSTEVYPCNTRTTALAHTAVLVALGLYACSLPGDIPNAPEMHGARLALLSVAAWLAVVVMPWLRTGRHHGFWQYARALVVRMLATALFTGVLYAGLAFALAALENLFGIEIRGQRFGELGAFLVGIFATWFFLAGVPRDLDALDGEIAYPRGLKIFAQYIVLPIALVYLVILYAYLGKVLLAWDWPRGWVTGLVLGFAATGTFSLLLLFPLRELPGSQWLQRASRWFHALMLPPVVMMFLALFYRIGDYGITEPRYLALALGVWIVIMSVYGLLRRGPGIKAFAVVLVVMALAASYGPWSAFDVSRASQVGRLHELLARNNLLVDGTVHKATAAVPELDARDISSVLSYLRSTHGYDEIASWFDAPLRKADSDQYIEPSEVASLIGIEYVRSWVSAEGTEISFRANRDAASDIAGFDQLLPSQTLSQFISERTYSGAGITLRASGDFGTLTVVRNEGAAAVDSLHVDMRALAERLVREYVSRNVDDVPLGAMTVDAASTTFGVRVIVRIMEVRREDGSTMPRSYNIDVLTRSLQTQATVTTPSAQSPGKTPTQ
jgi:hypothetical protein